MTCGVECDILRCCANVTFCGFTTVYIDRMLTANKNSAANDTHKYRAQTDTHLQALSHVHFNTHTHTQIQAYAQYTRCYFIGQKKDTNTFAPIRLRIINVIAMIPEERRSYDTGGT